MVLVPHGAQRGRDSLRSWGVSLLTAVIGVLLIAAIAEWAHHPAPTPIEDEAKP